MIVEEVYIEDIYTERGIEESLSSDSISPAEEGFLKGCLQA